MTMILTLPACAAPSAARQPDTTLDPAAGDPFAAALAAALTAGLTGAQPAPMALVTLGAPAQTDVSSDDGPAVTDVSLAAGSQTAETTVASSPSSTPRTLAPIAGVGAKLGEGTVASLAPAAAAYGALAPAPADHPATAPAAPPPSGGAVPSLSLSVNASRVAAPPAARRDGPAIEQPAPSPNEESARSHEEELDVLIGFAVRRLAARVAGVAQPKRGGAEGVAALPARWTPATEGKTPVPSAVPAAAEMAAGDTLRAGSEASLEGTQTWVGDVGSRHQLRLIKFPSMRSRLGHPTSPAPADASGAGEGGAPASGRPSPIRRTTRSGDPRVEAPRSAMTPAPSAPLAPAPASAMSVPAAPALSGAASLTEPASPLALVASEPLAPPPAPADRVTLRIGGEGGDATRVWVSVRGDTVHTRIATADAPAAAALTSALGELQSALERHGFTDASLRVLVPAPGPSDGRAAPPAAQAAVNVAAATTPSRGTDAPSDGNLPGRQRGQDTATDRPGQHGSRPHQRSPRERER